MALASGVPPSVDAGPSDRLPREPKLTPQASIRRIDSLLIAGRPADAEAIANRILIEARANDHPGLFALLDTLTWVFSRRTYPLHALRYGDELLDIGESQFARESLEHTRLVLRHAMLLYAVGDLEAATQQGFQALDLARRNRAMGLEELADFHENVATMAGAAWAHDSVRVLLDHALELRSRSATRDSFAIATTMRKLATLDRDEAEYAQALVLIEEAIAIAERHVPPSSERLLEFYNNYGAILGMLHDDGRANETFRRCVRLASTIPGYPRLHLARFLNNVGLSEYMLGNYAAAHAYHDSARAIREAIGDEGGVIESLRNMALVAARTGRTAEAESLLARCSAWGLGSRAAHALIEGQRFDLFLASGRLDDAAASLDREFALLAKITSPGHPTRIEASYRQALLFQARGEAMLAVATCLDADSLERSRFSLTARALSERQALDYRASRPELTDLALSQPAGQLSAGNCARLWDAILQGRGQVLEEMAHRRRGVRAVNDSSVRILLEELAVARRDYGRRFLSMSERTSATDSLLETSRRRIETLEAEVAKRSLPFREELRRNSVGFDAVRRALPNNAALVAFVLHRVIHAEGSDSEQSYTAFALSSGEPHMVGLGDAAVIDSLVLAWREAIVRRPTSQAGLDRQGKDIARAGASIRRAIWDPVRPLLHGVGTVFLVPDGALNHLNFAALPDSNGGYLVESDPLLHVLSSERDLVLGPSPGEHRSGLLVVAAPDYEATPNETRAVALASHQGSGATLRGPRVECADLARVRFVPLPAAIQEGQRVAEAWRTGKSRAGAELLSGPAASEAAFVRAVSTPQVVHLATHAFFLSDDCDATASGAEHRRIAVRENPLRRSGLALAGANRRSQAKAGEEDGMLTAEEIAALDLDGVDWVVLSACETGLGDVRAGEGVFGLRRAFAIAGARTTVMSLWPVEDAATSRWMVELYRARFVARASTAEAVRQASRAIIGRLRARGADTNPSVWAGFIAAGDWR